MILYKNKLIQLCKKIPSVYWIGGIFSIIYFCIVKWTSFGIPCMFHLITGLKCPGCGVTRMILALSSGNFIEAFHYNQAVFILLPIWAISFAIYKIWNIKTLKEGNLGYKIIMYSSLIFLILFGILRNIC